MTTPAGGAGPEADRLVVVGQGYVGLPLAMRAVEVGYRVVGFDVDANRVKLLEAGESPVEDVGDDELRAALDAGTYLPTADPARLEGFDVAVISVPTPLTEGSPDLSFIDAAARALAPALRAGATVVLESTTYPGTTEELVLPAPRGRLGPGGRQRLPPRLQPRAHRSRQHGRTASRTRPRWCRASTRRRSRAVQSFYDRLVETTVPVSSPREAELTKLLENTFRHVNIALVNELAMYAHDLGIDVWEAIDAASTKPFGYLRFTPGPGVGGHCLPIDPSYLSWRVRESLGVPFRFVELANDVNDHMPDYVVRRVTMALNERRLAVNGQRILLLGLAYKRNTGDARESPSRRIADLFVDLGAEVLVADPHVDDRHLPDGVTRVDATPELAETCTAVVLLVDHDGFDLDAIAARAPYLLDTRHRVSGPGVEYL